MPPIPPLNLQMSSAARADQTGNVWGFGDHVVSYGGGPALAGVPSWLLIAGLGLGLYFLSKRK
jgi:hypothetical protein